MLSSNAVFVYVLGVSKTSPGWDKGGYSESKVVYDAAAEMFYMFFTGADGASEDDDKGKDDDINPPGTSNFCVCRTTTQATEQKVQ